MKKPKALSSKQLLKFTLKSLEDDKGIDIVSIDLVGRSSIADYMIVASGNTVRQVTAMANNLIKKFKEITNCPVLVNTSFNVRGEPIVNTPEDAFNCFMGTELDKLIIGNFYLDKKQQDSNLKQDYSKEFELD